MTTVAFNDRPQAVLSVNLRRTGTLLSLVPDQSSVHDIRQSGMIHLSLL
jgi:hypothetical protein